VPKVESEHTVGTAHVIDARDPDKDGDEGHQSDDGVESILGDYEPDPECVEPAACSGPDGDAENGTVTDDQLASTYAEDGSYDTTDIGTVEDEEDTDGGNGTDTDEGFETDGSATLLDIIGEAVVALWDDIELAKPARQRSSVAHQRGRHMSKRSEKQETSRSEQRATGRSEKHETGRQENLETQRPEKETQRPDKREAGGSERRERRRRETLEAGGSAKRETGQQEKLEAGRSGKHKAKRSDTHKTGRRSFE
jgi:hypothetical protein